MWRDLSRLVDVECKNGQSFNLKAFFRPEVDGDVNIPQAGLCDRKLALLESKNTGQGWTGADLGPDRAKVRNSIPKMFSVPYFSAHVPTYVRM